MVDPSALRELLEAVEIPDPYRNRVGAYGPDAARALLSLYDSLRKMIEDDYSEPLD